MSDWKQMLAAHSDMIPWLGAVGRRLSDPGTPAVQFRVGDMLQSLVVSGVVGLIVLYGTTQKFEVQLATQAAANARLESAMARLETKVDARFEKVEAKVDSHIQITAVPARPR